MVAPFPAEDYPLLWSWLNEFPERNFDDRGPKSVKQLGSEIRLREHSGEFVWQVRHRSIPVGAIGYIQKTREIAAFHGICFSKHVHGTGIPLEAVGMALELAFGNGTTTVEALYFWDNRRVARFLRKLGGDPCSEEFIPCGSVRGGKPVHWRRTVIPIELFRAVRRERAQALSL